MSLARQPNDEPPRRPVLRIVEASESAGLPNGSGNEHGSPARGIVWGLVLSLVGFWLPLTAVVGRLVLK